MSTKHEIVLTKGNVPHNTAEPIAGHVIINMPSSKSVKSVAIKLKGVVETGWESNDKHVSYSGTVLEYNNS